MASVHVAICEYCKCTVCTCTETYFSHKERMFPELHAGEKIPTEQFLRACQGIADFVGFLGTAFIPVKNDIAGNVLKVRTKFNTDTEKLRFLQDLVDADIAERNGALGMATEGLLWLKRGLEFMLELLKQIVAEYRKSAESGSLAKTESLTGSLRLAYEKTLKRHHNFVSKQLFKVVIHAAPYRKTLLTALAYGNEKLEEICIHHIEQLLANFELNVNSLVTHYYLRKLETMPPPQPAAVAMQNK